MSCPVEEKVADTAVGVAAVAAAAVVAGTAAEFEEVVVGGKTFSRRPERRERDGEGKGDGLCRRAERDVRGGERARS